MRLRTSRGSLTTSWPRTFADPDVGISSVISILIVVVLPAPFGPSSPKSSPSATSKETPRTASTSSARRRKTPVDVLYVLRSSFASIAAIDYYNLATGRLLPFLPGRAARLRLAFTAAQFEAATAALPGAVHPLHHGAAAPAGLGVHDPQI